MMKSCSKEEILKSKVDLCAKCGRRVRANSVLCTNCGKWVHGRCGKMKRVILTLAKGFACKRCVEAKKGICKPAEELIFYDQMELVKSFCYLENRLIPSGGSEASVIAKTRIGCVKFTKCGNCFMEESFRLK